MKRIFARFDNAVIQLPFRLLPMVGAMPWALSTVPGIISGTVGGDTYTCADMEDGPYGDPLLSLQSSDPFGKPWFSTKGGTKKALDDILSVIGGGPEDITDADFAEDNE